MGRWGQIMAIFDDLQYCKSSEVGGPKKSQKHDDVILEWSLMTHYHCENLFKSKGQIISKLPFDVFNFFKNPNENTSHYI